MTRDPDQDETERGQIDKKYPDADRHRIGLLAKQKLQADVDEAHAAAERQPPCAARAAVHYREHGEGHGKNARNGHINAQHAGSSPRSTPHFPRPRWPSLDLVGKTHSTVTP